VTRRAAVAIVPRVRDAEGTDDALWLRDEFLTPVDDLLVGIRLLSLDIFDTLLFRTCERPEEVFVEVGRRAVERGLVRQGLTAGEFASLRSAAQVHAYSTLGREPTLEHIYALLPAAIGELDAILRLELDVEADCCFVNPSVASLVEHCWSNDVPVVLLSDMYLGEQRIRALLTHAGFDLSQVEQVIVSVDKGGYKKTGELFGVLRSLYPTVPPEAILHIGDNVDSDVRAARAAGLQAIHYDVVRSDPHGAHAIEQLVCGSILPELSALRRLAASLCGTTAPSDHTWFRVGAGTIGPFASALVDWAIDQCVADGITLIAPLMREGYMLAPLLQRAIVARGLSIEVMPLYVSRHAVALAGARDTGPDLLERLLDGRRHLTIGDLFSQIQLPLPVSLAPHASASVTSVDAIHVTPGQSLRAAIAAYLATEAVTPRLERLVRDERERLVNYLDAAFADHRTVATLDIGFFGNIQRSIHAALVAEGREVRPAHLLAFGHGRVRDLLLEGIDLRTFAGGYGDHGDLVRTIHRSAPVLEQLFQGREGSTVGYERRRDGRVNPRREPNPLVANELACKSVVQSGIVAFHDLWLRLRSAKPAVGDALVKRRGSWCRLVHRLIDVPAHEEARQLGTLHDDINNGSRAVVPFCPPSEQARVTWNGAEASYRAGASGIRAVWPQGIITRVDPGAIVSRFSEGSSRPYITPAVAMARALRARGIMRVIGYGSGDVAAAFIDAARIMGVAVDVLVDSNPRVHRTQLRGVDIVDLDTAVTLGVHVYAVLSFAHARAIEDTIRHRYAAHDSAPLVLNIAASGHLTR
jgi:FMN phosphatase YigB (HAD superfamily)